MRLNEQRINLIYITGENNFYTSSNGYLYLEANSKNMKIRNFTFDKYGVTDFEVVPGTLKPCLCHMNVNLFDKEQPIFELATDKENNILGITCVNPLNYFERMSQRQVLEILDSALNYDFVEIKPELKKAIEKLDNLKTLISDKSLEIGEKQLKEQLDLCFEILAKYNDIQEELLFANKDNMTLNKWFQWWNSYSLMVEYFNQKVSSNSVLRKTLVSNNHRKVS